MKINIFSTKSDPNLFTSGNVAAAKALYEGLCAIKGEYDEVTLDEGRDEIIDCTGDIHHFHEMGNWSSALAEKSTCTTKIMTMHTSPALDYDGIYDTNPNESTAQNLKAYDHIIVVNPREKSWVEQYLPEKLDSVTMLPNGVNTDVFKPDEEKRDVFRTQMGYTDEDDVVLMVAHTQVRKGILDLIELARYMPNKKFLLVGKPLYREHPRSLSLMSDNIARAPPNFKFVNGVDDIVAAYNGADKYICLSYSEGLPMTLLEAAACGLPCTCRKMPFYHEMFPFMAGFFQHTAEATFVLNDDKMQKMAGASARALVTDMYDYREVARKHMKLYADLI